MAAARAAASSRRRAAPTVLGSRVLGARSGSAPVTGTRASVTRARTFARSRATTATAGSRTRLATARAASTALILGQHADHWVDRSGDEIMSFLHPGHRLFDLFLRRLVTFRLRLGYRLSRMVNLDRPLHQWLPIEQKRRDHRRLLRQFHQCVMLAVGVSAAHTQVLDLDVVVAEEIQ